MSPPMFPHADDYVSKRTFLICAAIAGVAMAVTIIAVVVVALSINDIQERQIKENADRLHRQAVTDHELRHAIHDLQVLTHPTKKQYRQQLQQGIQRCLREPACRRLFPAIKANFKRGASSPSSSSTPASSSPGRTTPSRSPVSSTGGGGGSTTPTHPSRSPRPSTPSGVGQNSSPSAPPPTGGGNQPQPNPAQVHVEAPIPVQACNNPAIAINCP